MHLFPLRRPIALSVLLCAGVWGALCGGCGEAVESRGEDDGYLRAGKQTPIAAQFRKAALFPMQVGNWWEYQVQVVTVNADGAQTAALPYLERCEAAQTGTVDGTSGVRFDYQRDGKTVRSETYRHTKDGLFLLQAGTSETVTLTPPLALVRYPMAEGSNVAWDGLLTFAQSNAPGRAFSRLTTQETIATPDGKYKAWRVDTVVQTNLGGQAVVQIETRWLAPGVGVVRQESRSGNSITTRVLIGRKGSKPRRGRVQS